MPLATKILESFLHHWGSFKRFQNFLGPIPTKEQAGKFFFGQSPSKNYFIKIIFYFIEAPVFYYKNY